METEATSETRTAKYLVKGSPAEGMKFVWRAKRAWPADGKEIQVDPEATQDKGDVLTLDTLEILRADPRLSVTDAGGVKEALALQVSLKERDARIATLEAECLRARGAADAAGERATDLTKIRSDLEKRVAGLEAQLAEKTSMLAEAQAAIGQLSGGDITQPETPSAKAPKPRRSPER